MKIIEDVPLEAHTVKVVDASGRIVLPVRKPEIKDKTKDETESIMERLAPALENWLRGALQSMSVSRPEQKQAKKEEGRRKAPRNKAP